MFTVHHELYALRDLNYELSRLTLSGPEPYKLFYEAAVHNAGATEVSCVAVDSQILIARYTGTLVWYPQNSLRHCLKGRKRADDLVQALLAIQNAKRAAESASLFPSESV